MNTAPAQTIEFSTARTERDVLAIRTAIRTTEANADALLESSAVLMAKMVGARRTADVAPHMGQRAIMRLHKAQQSIISGMNDVFRVHDELSGMGVNLVSDELSPISGLSDADAV